MPEGRPLVLIGFMASGKTTVGRLLAGRLGLPFVDLDDRIVERAGKTIPELFRQIGETGFRQLEASALADLLADPALRVIAGGGGLVLRRSNRILLRKRAFTVFLDASFPEVRRRLSRDGGGRPLADNLASPQLGELYEDRRAIYRDAADLRIPADGAPSEIVKDIIMMYISSQGRLEKSGRKR